VGNAPIEALSVPALNSVSTSQLAEPPVQDPGAADPSL